MSASSNPSNFTTKFGAETFTSLVPRGPRLDHSYRKEESKVVFCVLPNYSAKASC